MTSIIRNKIENIVTGFDLNCFSVNEIEDELVTKAKEDLLNNLKEERCTEKYLRRLIF